ncbi:MAG: YajQ family cyclic di-GMP-binding protein [Deltaproteobacteria bacterium]|nr:YajQ family cyclic di-GMP-binding protein [Deltaproteobacteria bacterium]
MPSFDVVSQVNLQEVDNAVNQAVKEIATRYDFRGSKSQITFEKEKGEIALIADDDFKAKAVIDIVQSKIVKRGVDIRALDVGKIEPGAGGLVKCLIKLKQGIAQEVAKEMIAAVKKLNLKVQAQIQEDQLRVSGKNRDDLQSVIAHLRGGSYGLPLQFINFRE